MSALKNMPISFPGLFGDVDAGSLRIYDIIVCVILFITVLFANFAEAVAEGRGKAQAASLKKTQKDTEAHRLDENGEVIEGLYVLGNIMGDITAVDYPINVAGNSHGRCITFGYLLGHELAEA